ncbi:MAG: hypothetical protein HYR51_11590 [Candidatus Rokubacteria bacterium]|nr:hypothetical protein [Candidatus Rokubacteria bacterium]
MSAAILASRFDLPFYLRLPSSVLLTWDPEDAAAADEYEQRAAYKRIAATLASGKQAWVYVDARSAPGAG